MNDRFHITGRHLAGNVARAGRCCRLLLFFVIISLSSAVTALSAERGSAHAYLYLEPNSARFECLVPLREMMTLLGQSPESSITVEAQRKLCALAQEKTVDWLRMKVDGRDTPGAGTFRVMIVKGVPGRTEVLKPNEIVSSAEGMIGLMWEFDLPVVPEKIECTWISFSASLPALTTSIVAGSQSEEHELNAVAPSLEWINHGSLTMRSPLALVPPLPSVDSIRIPVISLLLVLLGLIAFVFKFRNGRKISGKSSLVIVVIVIGAVIFWPVVSVRITWPWKAVAAVSPEQAEQILTPLLRNVYRAFDQRQEGAIYDVLARSIEGDLLQRVYLQMINALMFDAQDATRARVTDLDVRVDSVRQMPKLQGFVADVQWTALGTVGHWGHQHQRVNRYTAKITVGAVSIDNGAPAQWKIIALEVEQETRM
ncbi:MAG: hypothetical protein K8R87_01820 [Verrucomicrobia bacterium]|nr:hypothetical protein [Verrucomicrobiota bacterium]